MHNKIEIEGTWCHDSKTYQGILTYEPYSPIILKLDADINGSNFNQLSGPWYSKVNNLNLYITIPKWHNIKTMDYKTSFLCDYFLINETNTVEWFYKKTFIKAEFSFDCIYNWLNSKKLHVYNSSDLVPFNFTLKDGFQITIDDKKSNNTITPDWDTQNLNIKIPISTKKEIEKVGLLKYIFRNNFENTNQDSSITPLEFIEINENIRISNLFGIDCLINISNSSNAHILKNIDNSYYIISITPDYEQNYLWYNSVYESLKDLFIILTGKQISPNFYKLYETTHVSYFLVPQAESTSYMFQINDQVLCPYPQLESLNAFLENWFKIYNTCTYIAIKTFTNIEFNLNIPDEIRFLSYVQAFESYLNLKYNDNIVDESLKIDFCNEIKKHIKSYFKDEDNEKNKQFRKRIYEQNNIINKFSLYSKIIKFINDNNLSDHFIFDNYSFSLASSYFKKNIEDLIKHLIKTRDKLTHHYSKEKPFEYLKDRDILELNQLLVKLIIMSIYLELGFDSDTAATIMEEYELGTYQQTTSDISPFYSQKRLFK